jgi:MprA protease rhombosortase-interaction domain-containing protein
MLLLAIATMVFAVAPARAVVSWNQDSNGTVTGANVAGLVPVSNWNNSWPSNPTTDLIDDSGAATTLDIVISSFNTWSVVGSHPGQDADGSYNKELLNGYLNAGPAGWNPPITYSEIAMSEIPYAAYDIIVYFSSDVAGREGTVTDGTTTYSFNTVGPPSVSGANALFAQTTDSSLSYLTAANYAVFSGLSGPSQAVRVQMLENDEWAGIAGFQVVAVPEPASAVLLVVSGLLAVCRRK